MPLPHFSAAIFLFCTLFVALTRVYTAVPISTPAADCGLQANEVSTTAEPDAIQLQIWAGAHGQNCWRVFSPVLAAQQIADQKIQVQPTAFEALYRVYSRLFVQAAVRGEAPDLAIAGNRDLVAWGKAGHIVPLDDCRARHATFAAIADELWTTQRWDDHVWGVPFQSAVQILFFSKPALRRLGWSPEQIAALPGQIERGQFTLDDLLAVAKEAVATGAVQPGYAFWPTEVEIHFLQLVYSAYAGRLYDTASNRLVINQAALAKTFTFARTLLVEKLTVDGFAGASIDSWFNNNLRRDALVRNRVLFWASGKGEWAEWERNYTKDLGGVDYLQESIGYALFPSAMRGTAGHAIWHSTDYYILASESATGRNQQEAACAVLAQTLTPEMNARLVNKSGNLGVLPLPVNEAVANKDLFTDQSAYMWNYAKPAYQRNAALFLWLKDYTVYEALLADVLGKAERGELSPTAAVTEAVERLRTLAADHLLVE